MIKVVLEPQHVRLGPFFATEAEAYARLIMHAMTADPYAIAEVFEQSRTGQWILTERLALGDLVRASGTCQSVDK